MHQNASQTHSERMYQIFESTKIPHIESTNALLGILAQSVTAFEPRKQLTIVGYLIGTLLEMHQNASQTHSERMYQIFESTKIPHIESTNALLGILAQSVTAFEPRKQLTIVGYLIGTLAFLLEMYQNALQTHSERMYQFWNSGSVCNSV